MQRMQNMQRYTTFGYVCLVVELTRKEVVTMTMNWEISHKEIWRHTTRGMRNGEYLLRNCDISGEVEMVGWGPGEKLPVDDFVDPHSCSLLLSPLPFHFHHFQCHFHHWTNHSHLHQNLYPLHRHPKEFLNGSSRERRPHTAPRSIRGEVWPSQNPRLTWFWK